MRALSPDYRRLSSLGYMETDLAISQRALDDLHLGDS
jgi:hypothetical protein